MIRKAIIQVGVVALLISGCSTNGSDVIRSSPNASESLSMWVKACNKYQPSGGEDFEVAYEAVIADVCQKANENAVDLPYEASPTVIRDTLDTYLDAEGFHISYWKNYMNSDFPTKERIIFTEKDQSWWERKMKEKILNPDLGWFTSKNEGGHCRVESDIFCPKLFDTKLTTNNKPIEFRIIGTKVQWQAWQLLNSAHESVHLYQDSFGMSHWAPWYVEGQATFFELASAKLLFNDNYMRRELVVTRPSREDALKFEVSTIQEVRAFLEECYAAKNGECESFKYGAGSLFHEKLVIDYGLDKYFEWQKTLASRMPSGNPATFSQAKQREVESKFSEIFLETFKVRLFDWEQKVMSKYLLEFRLS